MSGVALALAAGVGFGLFQAVNRRANSGLDAYRATFGLLAIGTVGMTLISLITQDLAAISLAPISALGFFAAAGIVHFFFGWTLLSLSQQKVGASETGATVAATPLIATVLAALVLDEALTLVISLGVLLAVAGLATLSLRRKPTATHDGFHVPWFGIGAAASWGTSPLFIRWGLEGLPYPLLGVNIGLAAAMLAYAVALTVTGRWSGGAIARSHLGWITLAGVLVAMAILAQWTSYDLIAIAVAVTLMQVSAPVVIVAAPLVVGTDLERATPALLTGTALIMSGSILAILAS